MGLELPGCCSQFCGLGCHNLLCIPGIWKGSSNHPSHMPRQIFHSPGKVILLPGTFETIQPTGLIKRGDFDAAGMFMVSEHLPDNRLVVEGVFEWTKPGQLLR